MADRRASAKGPRRRTTGFIVTWSPGLRIHQKGASRRTNTLGFLYFSCINRKIPVLSVQQCGERCRYGSARSAQRPSPSGPSGTGALHLTAHADQMRRRTAKGDVSLLRSLAPCGPLRRDRRRVLGSRKPRAIYDGYGSCPLTVERGRIVLAEFGYGGKLLPTFPKWLFDGTRPSRLAWLLKERILPPVYWRGMLKGREWLAAPQVFLPSPDTLGA
jgi:hypothetical protein